MGRVTKRIKTTRIDVANSRISRREDSVAAEEPLEIRLGHESFAVTMRTPGDDFDLMAGFLLAEGVISHPSELISMRFCAGEDENGQQTYNVLQAQLRPDIVDSALANRRNVTTSSACGICGTASIDAVKKTSHYPISWPLESELISASLLAELPERLRDAQKVFDKTGGVHAAGLFTNDAELLVLREDVGRHNAVDKVMGVSLREGHLPLSNRILQVSGRASFELVQKAAMAGVPLLAAVSAPSSLAVELAQESGITLVGFSRGTSMNVYTHPGRIGLGDSEPAR